MPSEPITKTRRHQLLDLELADRPLQRISGKGSVGTLRDYAIDRRRNLRSWRTMAAELGRHVEDGPSDKNLWDWLSTDPEIIAAYDEGAAKAEAVAE